MKVYILTKQNDLIGKWILRSSKKVFIYDGIEYNIDPKRQYRSRILFKRIFFSIYQQDNPDPVLFQEGKAVSSSQDIPINELAYFIHLLRKGNLTLVAEIMAILGGVVSIIALYYIYKNYEVTQQIMNYLFYLRDYMDELNNVTFPVV